LPGHAREMAADGGTGSPDGAEAASPDVADLYEYCLSLGIDADQDEDLLWVVHEAFNAPLPGNAAEYTNEEGRVYYFNEVTGQSSWEHPLDQVYRECLELVKRVRTEAPSAPEEQRKAIVRDHLQEVHGKALVALEGWCGPYPSEQGEYYHNEVLQVSSWESPVAEREKELEIRHAVLCRCLLPEKALRSSSTSEGSAAALAGSASRMADLLPSLHLPLNLLKRDPTSSQDAVPQTPSTTRSFHTARSSARSGGSTRSKKRSERYAGISEEERRTDRQERRAARERRAQERGCGAFAEEAEYSASQEH